MYPTEAAAWAIPLALRCSCALCSAVQAFLCHSSRKEQTFDFTNVVQQRHLT